MDLQDRHIVVTGAGSGLGAATARHFAERGARVSVLDLNGVNAAKTASAIGGHAFPCDVLSEAAGAVLDRAEAAAGPIRGLVNCAGIAPAARIAGKDGPMDLASFELVIRVNLIGTFNMMRLAADRMTRAAPDASGEGGVIVNTASVAAFDGQVGQAAYAAAKGGIVALALPAARELARFGIRVNTIAPGVFRTPLLASLPQETQDGIAATIPHPPRLGDPDEFAAAVRFCFETPYLNAEVIRLDGGVRLPPR